ncbi:dihydrofolate reductase [Dyadobacter crusticola]|uniref:dihydrofolate reductase n=1 Tax=Dyadobacter crusticola TaxID=292407 RepID=UPI0009FDB345|nr:dihydrofolate reductase [Dyadobacter crusticola]
MTEQPSETNQELPRPALYIIAAMSENRVIGKENHLPWHLPDEWKHFKEVTADKAFIMGRTSFEAPDALHSSRLNVILSSKTDQPQTPGTVYAKDIPQALALLSGETEVFVLGGGHVFTQMLPLADRLYLTIVHAQLEGDAFFPVINPNEWELTNSEYHGADEAHSYSFSMNLYVRKTAD